MVNLTSRIRLRRGLYASIRPTNTIGPDCGLFAAFRRAFGPSSCRLPLSITLISSIYLFLSLLPLATLAVGMASYLLVCINFHKSLLSEENSRKQAKKTKDLSSVGSCMLPVVQLLLVSLNVYTASENIYKGF